MKKLLRMLFQSYADEAKNTRYIVDKRAKLGYGTCLTFGKQFLLWLFGG